MFASLKQAEKKKVMIYLAVLGIVINYLIPFILSIIEYFLNRTIKWPIQLSVATGNLIYPIIGYILHTAKIDKKRRLIIYFFALCGFITHLAGTYFLSVENGEIIRLFKGYTKLPALLYSCGVFVLFKQLSERKILQKCKKIILFLSKYTFALYLTHIFVLFIVEDLLVMFNIPATSIIFLPVAFILIVPICILITHSIRLVPGGNKILP